MNSSASIAELSAALSDAAANLANPLATEQANTGKFSYSYAGLPVIVAYVRRVLAEHDLFAVQEATNVGGDVGVLTRIIHASGEWLEFGPLFMPGGSTPQEHGSALTYARRYALTSALLLAAEEDDDAASVKTKTRGVGEKGHSGGGTSPQGDAPSPPSRSNVDGGGGVAGRAPNLASSSVPTVAVEAPAPPNPASAAPNVGGGRLGEGPATLPDTEAGGGSAAALTSTLAHSSPATEPCKAYVPDKKDTRHVGNCTRCGFFEELHGRDRKML